ncbi:CLUMA_CG013667, isoform A [Clunio marinus]|uniref:CLUMA_CG013667, isoform A n=1 Tax=Clunio marinus TaxID=568069 RepID=A0A1J1IJN5_9DIPT|nr:CLUMA_CG013667, isoform A [Clunio marinus]
MQDEISLIMISMKLDLMLGRKSVVVLRSRFTTAENMFRLTCLKLNTVVRLRRHDPLILDPYWKRNFMIFGKA